MGGGHGAVGSGQWAVSSGQWAVGSVRWGSGQCAVGNCGFAAFRAVRLCLTGKSKSNRGYASDLPNCPQSSSMP